MRVVWNTDGDEELTIEAIRAKYAMRTDATDATTAAFIEVGDRPVGYLQFYRWTDFADDADAMGIQVGEGTWGLDVFIGVPDLIDRGIGSRAVDLLCRYLRDDRGADQVALLTAIDNGRAARAYEKAGFRKKGPRLDSDTRGGVRIGSWLMIRDLTEIPR